MSTQCLNSVLQERSGDAVTDDNGCKMKSVDPSNGSNEAYVSHPERIVYGTREHRRPRPYWLECPMSKEGHFGRSYESWLQIVTRTIKGFCVEGKTNFDGQHMGGTDNPHHFWIHEDVPVDSTNQWSVSVSVSRSSSEVTNNLGKTSTPRGIENRLCGVALPR